MDIVIVHVAQLAASAPAKFATLYQCSNVAALLSKRIVDRRRSGRYAIALFDLLHPGVRRRHTAHLPLSHKGMVPRLTKDAVDTFGSVFRIMPLQIRNIYIPGQGAPAGALSLQRLSSAPRKQRKLITGLFLPGTEVAISRT